MTITLLQKSGKSLTFVVWFRWEKFLPYNTELYCNIKLKFKFLEG